MIQVLTDKTNPIIGCSKNMNDKNGNPKFEFNVGDDLDTDGGRYDYKVKSRLYLEDHSVRDSGWYYVLICNKITGDYYVNIESAHEIYHKTGESQD